MKNSFKVTWDDVLNIENRIIEVDNKEEGFVTCKENTITFQEINFYDIEFLSLYDDKIFLQYYISDDQKNLKKEVNILKINEKNMIYKILKN
ncbi:hypothetical protein [Sulfurimonas hydrogeniphila]|uniref:hypothetical protein n=1 Tax=Sulfurimonas hydrogeniphila TaxID=2509341 RepID=UPI00125F4156|nr:hypothetical protein [Sulfurimonas hydrogeniphila]